MDTHISASRISTTENKMRRVQLDLKEAAKEAAGNWRRFSCFVWWRERDIDDSENWAVIYSHHRDSGLLDQSNAAIIRKALLPFTDTDEPDVVFESHSHWAVGYVDGFSLRVFKRGRVTKAFKIYHELGRRMDEYPILDESDYSEREFEATLENIPLATWKLKDTYALPNDWQSDVYSWLSEHRCNALENTDDQGGWPDEEDLEEAFVGLGYERVG